MKDDRIIYVYADFLSFHNELIGKLYVSNTKGREFYSFEYDNSWLKKNNIYLDPDLQLYKGRQYTIDGRNIFGLFADSCPDRWGQRLMKRREEIRAKKCGVKPVKLMQSDYLLGVYDEAWKRIVFSMAVKYAISIKETVHNNWRSLAKQYGISHSEADRMSPAFMRL